MKTSLKMISVALSLTSLVAVFSACNRENTGNTPTTYVYKHENETNAESATANKEKLNIDTDWQSNYYVTYKYYNADDEADEVSVTEKRSMNAFSVEYLNQEDILYYVANGSNIDYYVLVPDETEQVHSVIKNKTLKDLSSTFMKLTAVSAEFPTLDNVIYVGQDSIAGRDAEKYIQRAYKNGEATQTVYIWIDKEYGFASKCECYDSNNRITTSWELLSFKSGNIKDTDVEIDLKGYTFKEE